MSRDRDCWCYLLNQTWTSFTKQANQFHGTHVNRQFSCIYWFSPVLGLSKFCTDQLSMEDSQSKRKQVISLVFIIEFTCDFHYFLNTKSTHLLCYMGWVAKRQDCLCHICACIFHARYKGDTFHVILDLFPVQNVNWKSISRPQLSNIVSPLKEMLP